MDLAAAKKAAREAPLTFWRPAHPLDRTETLLPGQVSAALVAAQSRNDEQAAIQPVRAPSTPGRMKAKASTSEDRP
jgi:hypothetical protein